MKAKKLLALLLTLCMLVSLFPMAFAVEAEYTFWDVRNTDNVTTEDLTVTLDGKALKIKSYTGHYYTEDEENQLTVGPGKYGPSGDRDDCQVEIYVPEGADADSAVMFLIENGSWAQSGFKPDVITNGAKLDSGADDRVALALKYHMIVVAYGARCRGSVDKATGEVHIHAPQMIADTKAAIRYVKYNIGLGTIPGDADKVVISGHSGGGAMGSIIAATGNSPDFDPYLVNAAPATDDVFAVMASAPITDLAMADQAYEWTFGDYREGSPYDKLSYDEYDEAMLAFSDELAADYSKFISKAFGLTDEEYTAKITELFAESVQHEIDLAADLQYSTVRPETDDRGWFKLDENGDVASFDLDAYTKWAVQNAGITDAYKGNELKGIMAFNSEGMTPGYKRNENNLWGTASQAYSIAYPQLWDRVANPSAIDVDKYDSWDEFWAAEGENIAKQMKAVSVMPYLVGNDSVWYLDGVDTATKSDIAPNWFIRHGMGDVDTSYAVVASLILGVKKNAENVNAYFGWERGHNGGGNTYYQEFFQWMEDNGWIGDPYSIEDAKVTKLNVTVDGKSTTVTEYVDEYYPKPSCADQIVTLYVPANATKQSPIIFMVNNGGWFMNQADKAYKVTDGGEYVSDSDTDVVGKCLAEGYIIMSAGSRNRMMPGTGHSPATMSDYKAAIRWLRYNDDAIGLGDTAKIVVTGTSGGGALSTVLAASGNSSDYYPDMYANGAYGIDYVDGKYVNTGDDSVWAVIAYCPITDIGHACAAYEWQYSATRTAMYDGGFMDYGALDEKTNMTASAELKAIYKEYLDSIGIDAISAANMEDSIIELMEAEIAETIEEVGVEQMKKDLAATDYAGTWITFNEDGSFVYDYEEHLFWLARKQTLKPASAFSNFGMPQWKGQMNEDNLFGEPTDVYCPFNEYSWNHDATENAVGKDDTGLTWEQFLNTDKGKMVQQQARMTSSVAYLLDKTDDAKTAPYWYVRHGMADRDTAFAVETTLYHAMKNDASIRDVNFEFAWLQPHGGNYDVQEAYEWLETLVPDAVVTNQSLKVDGESAKADIYNIADNNYFKLRDIAFLLKGSDAEFAVSFDNAKKEVYITTGAKYEVVGGELAAGVDKSATCVISAFDVYVDGKLVDAQVYNIGGNNYFKLRDMGKAIGFGVDYDAATRTMLVTTK